MALLLARAGEKGNGRGSSTRDYSLLVLCLSLTEASSIVVIVLVWALDHVAA